MNYILNEGLADTVMVYLIIKKLSTPFKEWPAYDLGLIDDRGNKTKEAISFKERKTWTAFDRFIANLKKILTKFAGPSRFAAVVTSAFLLRDSQKTLLKKNLLLESNTEIELTAIDQLKIKRLMDVLQIETINSENESFVSFLIERNINNVIDKDLNFLKMGEFSDE